MRTTHRWFLAGAAGVSLLCGGIARAGQGVPPQTNLGGTAMPMGAGTPGTASRTR